MILIIIIAISLSMDAFSLSLAYGTLNLSQKSVRHLSFIVGIFHFIMPLFGMSIGTTIFHIMPLDPAIIVFLILGFIGIQMIIESFKNIEATNIMTLRQLLLFGFAVSVDSFAVGIGLKAINNNYFLSAFIFCIFSFLFTYLGLMMGKKINKLIGKTSTFIGGIILIIIGILYLIH